MIRNVTDGGLEYRALMFWCPGCENSDSEGGLHMLPIQPYSGGKPCWTFSGTEESPTLEPSILTKMGPYSGFICHSYLRNGVIEYLEDCTHKYKGQKIAAPPLPDWVVKI